jgi:hypothetical protein
LLVFLDDKVITVDAAPSTDDDLKSVLTTNNVVVDHVMAKPTVAARGDGKFDVTAKVLRVVPQQIPASPT